MKLKDVKKDGKMFERRNKKNGWIFNKISCENLDWQNKEMCLNNCGRCRYLKDDNGFYGSNYIFVRQFLINTLKEMESF